MILKNVNDAVSEGDGDRIIRCWRFFLLYFRAYGHHKYAYAAFLLISNVTAALTPMKAHQLIWNRTTNRKGGKGANISLDLRVEQLNNLTKELLYNVGANLNESTAKREGNAIGFLESVFEAINNDLSLKAPGGKHKVRAKHDDLALLVKSLAARGIFKKMPGREHTHFKKFDGNLLSKLDVSLLFKWLKEHKNKLAKKRK